MVLDPAGPVAQRRLLHGRRAVAAAYRCFHRRIQRDRRTIRLDQEKSLSAAVQKTPYHSTLIPGTSVPIPKFANIFGTLSCELRNQRDTSNSMILVPLFEPEVCNRIPGTGVRTSG